MRTELRGEIPVERCQVFAEMAWLQHRPELGAICRMARDTGGRITSAVVEMALPGLAEVGTQNLVRRCQELDLCDGSGSLTGLGETVAETDDAPSPSRASTTCGWPATPCSIVPARECCTSSA